MTTSKPRILFANRQSSSVGYYRSWLPARALEKLGYPVTAFPDSNYKRSMKPNVERWMQQNMGKFDVVVVDRCTDANELGLFSGFRHHSEGTRMIVDFDDDFHDVPWWNAAEGTYQPGQDARRQGDNHLRLAELTTVSTDVLAERYAERAHEVVVCPNFIDPSDWERRAKNPARRKDKHLRILYGGAQGHYGDLEEARKGIEALLDRPPVPLRFISFGAVPAWVHEKGEEYPGRVVNLPFTHIMDYPDTIGWGGFDVAIAPLADHPFNTAKSNIKWLEAAIQGIPFVCSDVGPYASIPDGCAIRIANTPIQWAEALRQVTKDRDLRKALAERAKAEVLEHWTLDKLGAKWEIAIEQALARPRIESLADTRLPGDAPPAPEAASPPPP